MANEEETIQTKFHAFLQQKNSKGNATMQEAQKLVNLYRLLNCLGPNFVDEYNTMLLSASDEVLMTLNALVGGQEVRQYFNFLSQDKRKEETQDGSDKTSQNVGWLPSPAEEGSVPNGNYVSTEDWNAYVKAEREKITELITKLREEQNETLRLLTDQLTASLHVKSSPSQNTVGSAPLEYSEIIEDKDKERS